MSDKTKNWAIGPRGKPSAGHVRLELLNRDTLEAHVLVLRGFGAAQTRVRTKRVSSYKKFQTPVEVSFSEFAGCLARVKPSKSHHELILKMGNGTKVSVWIFFYEIFHLIKRIKNDKGYVVKRVDDYITYVSLVGFTQVEFGDGKPTMPLTYMPVVVGSRSGIP